MSYPVRFTVDTKDEIATFISFTRNDKFLYVIARSPSSVKKYDGLTDDKAISYIGFKKKERE
ncbi:hypothetical protein KAX02_03435 [candidate division WOR-3 bacterium]|nr:hypothetical protein [candidate division WOR-3 bacterium]